MEIFQLLSEFGLDVKETDFLTAKIIKDNKYAPVSFHNNIPAFTSEQVAIFGPPELYGYETYEVIELNETISPMVTDWQMEQDLDRPRPIHRYDRVERFEFILAQLLGLRGDVPDYVMAMMCYIKDSHDCWNRIRATLKHYKHRKYYNRIPQIIFRLGFGSVINWDRQDATYRQIINDFKKLQHVFEYAQKREKWKRSYFPNLRFIAIKLLERYGATCNFDIDFIRTKRKRKALIDLWNDFQ